MRELTPDEMVSDLLADIQIKLDSIPGLSDSIVREIMDAITPTVEARDVRERYFPTTTDCRFALIDTKNGGKLLYTFDVEGLVSDGDVIAVPPFTLSNA